MINSLNAEISDKTTQDDLLFLIQQFEGPEKQREYRLMLSKIEKCFETKLITTDNLDYCSNILLFYFVNYKKINKKYFDFLLAHSNIDKYNQSGFNSIFSYFRNAREKKIKLTPDQIEQIICHSSYTSKIHNLFAIYCQYDYGYTKLNDQSQEHFLKNLLKDYSIKDLSESLFHYQFLSKEDRQKKINNLMKVFNFKLPIVKQFFNEINSYFQQKSLKKIEREYQLTIDCFDRELTKQLIKHLEPPTKKDNKANKI